MRERVNENYQPGDQIKARDMTVMGRIANRTARRRVNGASYRHTGTQDSVTIPRKFDQVPMEITADNNDGTYKAKTRYLINGTWKTNEDETGWPVDARDAVLRFEVGDRIVAMWDEQVKSFIPSYAPHWFIGKTRSGGIPKRSGDFPGQGQVTMYLIDGDGQLQIWRDTEGAARQRAVYNLASSGPVPGDTYIQMAKEGIGGALVAVWEDCEPEAVTTAARIAQSFDPGDIAGLAGWLGED